MKCLISLVVCAFLFASVSCNSAERKNNVSTNDSIQKIDLLATSDKILVALQHKKFEEFATYVHPQKGVRFSASTFVDTIYDKVLKKQEIIDLSKSKKVFTWGMQEAIGEPIKMDISKYSEQFIYDVDFLKEANKQLNKSANPGSTVNNISQVFPKCQFVEYFYPGKDKSAAGLDWKVLTLIFQNDTANAYLIGVSHAAWSP